MNMKLENLKFLLEYQILNNFDIELNFKHLEINNNEIFELFCLINKTNKYYTPQHITTTSNNIIIAKNKNNDDD